MRLTPTQHRIVTALRNAGERGILTGMLCRPEIGGERFGGRLHELKQAGYVIRRECIRRGQWRYILVSEPTSERAALGGQQRPYAARSDTGVGPDEHLFPLPGHGYADPEWA